MNKVLSTEFYILISLHNYFIMHDIKYFFSIKLIRQSRGGGITEGITEKYCFSKSSGGSCPPGPTYIRHWSKQRAVDYYSKDEVMNQ
jgi:hypothetical protein